MVDDDEEEEVVDIIGAMKMNEKAKFDCDVRHSSVFCTPLRVFLGIF